MNRTEKEDSVVQLRSHLQDSTLVVVTRPEGLTVAETTHLRFQMKEGEANFKVVKNTLARLCVKNTPMTGMEDWFKGATAIAYSKDPISAAKISVGFSEKNEKLKIVGGFMDGKILSAFDVKALAKLPSKDELRAKLIALLNAPATKVVRLLKEPAAQIARVVSAKAQQGE
jgi:large subunit ribosomal protein L10